MNTDIRIEALSIKAGGQTILHDLSLILGAGETLTILGETGAGKSLLATAILGDLPSHFDVSGAVFIDDKNILNMSQKARRKLWGRIVVMLPQEPWRSLSPLMKISRQVAEVKQLLFAKSKQKALQEASQSLSALGLADDLEKVPAQISGGMAQRTAFACVEATGARILLADEPTKGLDTALRQDVIRQLKQHASTGTLLTITHDVEVARQLGGKVMVMRNGKVVETGDADVVLTAPQSGYAKQLIQAAPQNWPNTANTQSFFPDLVTVRKLTLVRGKQSLFNNIHFTLGQGEVVGLFGNSGSGKTSLADAILGLVPYRGEIRYTQPLKRHEKLKLYQDPPSAFAPDVPLRTLLEGVVNLHHMPDIPLEALSQELGLSTSLLSRNANQVSGGELQRVALLRALLLRPKILVADEPTSRLDPITSQQIIQLLTERCRNMGCTLLLISHDREQLGKVCDRIIDVEALRDSD